MSVKAVLPIFIIYFSPLQSVLYQTIEDADIFPENADGDY